MFIYLDPEFFPQEVYLKKNNQKWVRILSHILKGESILIFYNSTQFLTLKPISLIVLESLISVIGVS